MIEKKLEECFDSLGVFVDIKENFQISDYIEDSISFISLIVEIEQTFGIEIEDKFLDTNKLQSFNDLVSLINHINKIKE